MSAFFTSPRRGEVEAGAPAQASGEGSLHALGLAVSAPHPTGFATLRRSTSPQGGEVEGT
jgi:hypothetical protein